VGAENGAVAVDKALTQRFELILMDIQMPVMDGFEATGKLRASGLTLPIIALTANAMKGFERGVFEAGCSGYLTKPIDIDRLVSTLADMLGGKWIGASATPWTDAPVDATSSSTGTADDHSLTATIPPAKRAPEEEADLPVVSRFAMHPRFRSTVIKFGLRIAEQMEAMERAWTARDKAELARFSHWLKGAGGTVGYDAFTEPATRLEQFAKAGDFEQAAAVVEQLRRLVGHMVVPEDRSTETAAQ
jgi:CheY-like chemotaxis protein